MEMTIHGTPLLVFLIITIGLTGSASAMMGRAIANNWQSYKLIFWYGALLGAFERFIQFSLFGGDLLSITGYLLHTIILIAIALLAFRITQVNKMLSQYPWRYQRSGLLGWKEKNQAVT